MEYSGSFTSYAIQISPSNDAGPTPAAPYTRILVLNPVTLADKSTALCFINFVPAGRAVPDSGIRPDTAKPIVFDLFAPMDDYAALVDLVRNEGPLTFFFDDATPNGWYLRTGSEPVGEGE